MNGVCSRTVSFDIDGEGRVHDVEFVGGCNGNLKAVSKLVAGHPVDEIVGILSGNTCGPRQTSCADQLARALVEASAQAR